MSKLLIHHAMEQQNAYTCRVVFEQNSSSWQNVRHTNEHEQTSLSYLINLLDD